MWLHILVGPCWCVYIVLSTSKRARAHGLLKKYADWNCSGCSLGGMCLQPVLTYSYMS